MMLNCVLVLALAVFGASASCGYGVNGFNGINGGFGTFGGRVSDVCRCVKTVVRPHIRADIATIPTVQRYVRTETTPVIERIPYSVSRRVDAPGYVHGGLAGAGVLSGGIGGAGVLSGGLGGVGGFSGAGFGGAGVGVLSGVSTINTGYGY